MSMNSLFRQSIATDLNNLGVALHGKELFDEAKFLYGEAMLAMKDLALAGDSADCQYFHQASREWQEKLKQRRRIVLLRLSSSNNNRSAQRLFSSNFQTNMSNVSQQALLIDRRDAQTKDDTYLSVIVLYNMALIQIQMNAKDKSIELLEMALSLVGNELDVMRCDCTTFACVATQCSLGLLLFGKGMLDDSLDMLMQAVRIGSGSEVFGDSLLIAGALNTVGHIMAAKGATVDAIEFFEAASRIYDQHDITALASFIETEVNMLPIAGAA